MQQPLQPFLASLLAFVSDKSNIVNLLESGNDNFCKCFCSLCLYVNFISPPYFYKKRKGGSADTQKGHSLRRSATLGPTGAVLGILMKNRNLMKNGLERSGSCM